MKLAVTTVVAVVMLVALQGVACFAGSERYGGTLVWSGPNNYPTADPMQYRGSAVRECLAPVYSTLFQYLSDGQIVGDAALSIEAISSTQFRIVLRPGIQFHNGDPVTARDVVFSVKRMQDPATGASKWRSQLAVVTEVRAVDDFTLDFTLKEPRSAQWMQEIFAQVETPILSEAWVTAKGAAWDYTQHMGSGPFMFSEFRYNDRVILVRNPNYYRFDADGNRLPYLDRIEFVGYRDNALRIAAIKSGAVDCDAYMPWENIDEVKAISSLTVELTPEAFMSVTFNVARPPFDNKLVRQAFAYAIQREKVVDLAFYGYSSPIYGGILGNPKWGWAYNPASANRFEYNPAKAKELLAQAGYPNGFTAAIVTSADDQMHIDTSQIVIEDMRAIGVDITMRLVDWGQKVSIGNSEDYDLASNGELALMLDPDWLSSTYYGAVGGYYVRPANWNFPEMDRLLDQARVTFDINERKSLYAQWEELYLDECPSIFLVNRDTAAIRQNWVQGFTFHRGGLRTQSADSLEHAWLDTSSPRKKSGG